MRRVTMCLLLGLLLPVAGCGPGEAVVSGSVTLDGKPLEDGNIAFRPLPVSATSEAAVGQIKGGKFEVKVRTGQCRVEITATRAASTAQKDQFGPGAPPTSLIPDKYNSKSELTEDIPAGGKSELNFALKSR